MITFHCKCGQKIKVPEEHAGKKGRCPGCKQVIRIPETSQAAPSDPHLDEILPVTDREIDEQDTAIGEAVEHQESTSKEADALDGVLGEMLENQRSAPTEYVLAEEAKSTKSCPYCAETILATAKKCKHCGEFLEKASRPAHPLNRQPARLQSRQQPRYGGISRLVYFLSTIGLSLLFIVLMNVTGTVAFWFVINAFVSAISLVLIAYRLRNVGMSGWWSLLALAPVGNLLIFVRCILCPEGYNHTKVMDMSGKITAGVIIGVSAFAVVSVLFGIVLPIERLFVLDYDFDSSMGQILTVRTENLESLGEFVIIAKQIRMGLSEGITFADLTDKQSELRDAYALLDRQAVPASLIYKAEDAFDQIKELREIWRKDIYESEYSSYKELLQTQMRITGLSIDLFLVFKQV